MAKPTTEELDQTQFGKVLHKRPMPPQPYLEQWDKIIIEKNTEIERLRAALKAIERHTAPSTRTFDDMMRDMGLANDLARGAIVNEQLTK